MAVDLSTKRFLLPHINREGWKFVAAAAIIGALLTVVLPSVFGIYILCGWGGVFTFALTYAVYLFFRDPERVPPEDEKAVLSPADGYVCLLREIPLPKELGRGEDSEKVWCVSVFMTVLDVHVNRMPVAATIEKAVYVPGAFFNASLDKASEKNERMIYLTRTDEGRELAFVQIAGLVARRIVRFAKEGDRLERAERFGLIRFGSRLDVYLPAGVKPAVRIGQKMVAGETVLASL